ncbi:cellulose synthase/poly-beta-1,6-N-acetylglucosamine synthase-like glycosyltransferase [Pedobacter sp. UYP30]|uniref:glycosyltransferase n=1 Tax=Pedobacter sp. UYP30 TaxID=1756400 RepID=UPI00339192F2
MIKKGITIIICTYNGVERLGQTLAHIARLTIPSHIKIELILADNNSNDNSTDFAKEEWRNLAIPNIAFKAISETKPGKLYALQKAIYTAEYEYLIICDDDNWLAKNYLIRVFNNLENMPNIAAFGGFGVAVTDAVELPAWFKDYHYAYAVGSQSKAEGIMKQGSVLWGAGLATRKTLYEEMYQNFPSIIPTSKFNILSAEDTEYCLRLAIKGYRLFYDSEMIYQHHIPKFKLTKKFLEEKLLRGFDNSRQTLGKYYPAVRVYLKAKNRPVIWLYLFLSSCFRYLFFKGRRKIKAKDTLFHLLPFWIKSDPISTKIKSFVKTNRIASR